MNKHGAGDMSEQRKDGGPAFPQLDCYVDAKGEKPVYASHDGMSLRDYFAAKVFPVAAVGAHRSGEDFLRIEHYEDAALNAYRLADAMLKARQQ